MNAWPKIRRWFTENRLLGRRTAVLAMVLVLLGLGHAPFLRLLARPLTVRQPPPPADFCCLHGVELGIDGFDPFDYAVAWRAQQPGRKILLLVPPDSRIVEIGAVPSFERTCRGELEKRGIPPSDVRTVRATGSNVWGEAHAMAAWLKENPGSTVVLACSPFSSGRLRYVFDKAIGPTDAARVQLILLSDPGSDSGRWWRTRSGVKDFMYGWLKLIFAWVKGDDSGPAALGAASFQEKIRAQIGEAPP